MKVHSIGVGVNADKLVKKVALVIDSHVVLGTPVDEGRARSSWVVGISKPSRLVPKNFPKGKDGSTRAEAGQKSIKRAQERIASRKSGQTIVISNNVSYIGDLNDGTSDQAPKNFVELAILTGIRSIKGVKLVA